MSATYNGYTLVDRSKCGLPRNYTEQIIYSRELYKEIIHGLKDEELNKEWDIAEHIHQKKMELLLKQQGGVCPDQDMMLSHFGGANY